MIRTFPESCLILLPVDRAIRQPAPVPVPALDVYYIAFNIPPRLPAHVQPADFTSPAEHFHETDYCLCLHPPMSFLIPIAGIMFIHQTTILPESFLTGSDKSISKITIGNINNIYSIGCFTYKP